MGKSIETGSEPNEADMPRIPFGFRGEEAERGMDVRIPEHKERKSGFIGDLECSSIQGRTIGVKYVGEALQPARYHVRVVCSACSH